jgi:hypothetical protein
MIGTSGNNKGQPWWRTHGHRQDPGATVLAQNTDRLRASGLDCGREAPVCLVPGQLKRYLHTRVSVQASYIRSTPSTYIDEGGGIRTYPELNAV